MTVRYQAALQADVALIVKVLAPIASGAGRFMGRGGQLGARPLRLLPLI